MIMAILLIRQIDRSCRSSENRALSDGRESSGIVLEWCAKASPVEQEMDDSVDFERYRDITVVDQLTAYRSAVSNSFEIFSWQHCS